MPPRRLHVVEGAPAGAPGPATGDKTVKVALATQDMKSVNAHFAGAPTMVVYDVGPETCRLVEAIQFDQRSAEDGVHTDDNDDRITPRLKALEGCTLLFVKAIGGPAAAKVVKQRVHPMKAPDEPIESVLTRVQDMLAGTPPPWLRKAMETPGDTPSFVDED